MADAARSAVLEALFKCRRNGAWSAQTIDSVITKYDLRGRDSALAVNICLGVLQNMSLCDFYIDSFCNAKSKIEPKVRDILRMAVYQLVFMDKIPANAAVNEAVNLCKTSGATRASGFVNAVLRKIASSKDNLPDVPDKGTVKYLAVRYSHPQWLAQYMIERHGYEFAEAFFKANNEVSETTIQVNTLKVSTEELLKKLDCTVHTWLYDCLIVKGSVKSLYGFDEGYFYVQDPAAKCAVSISGLKPGMRVLDACAAPGGKSFAAAISMNNTGSILSCDLHEKKLSLINESAKRLGIEIIDTEAFDARNPRTEKFDVIIADVPCSGYGVIRKKPDIRFKDESDRKGLPPIQLSIINNLAKSVVPGGALIYSTCTVFSEENEDVVNAFLKENSDFKTESFTLPDGTYCKKGMYTFWPNINGTDGFFVCKLRRDL